MIVKRQKAFSKELSKSDKAALWMNKHLTTKYEKKGMVEAYDKDGPQNASKLANVNAAAGGLGAGTGMALAAKLLGGSNKMAAKQAGKFGLVAAAGNYVGARIGHKLNRMAVAKNPEGKLAKRSQKTADMAKVNLGKMSKEEFIEKYGKEKKDK